MTVHDLSMVFSEREIMILKKIMNITGQEKLNKSVSFIIRFMRPYIRKKHYKINRENLGYRKISWVKKLHVGILENDYKLLKLIHANLGSHSIAGIIRDMLEMVFKYFDLFGVACFAELSGLLKRIQEEITAGSKSIDLKREFPETYHYRNDYNNHYDVIVIKTG